MSTTSSAVAAPAAISESVALRRLPTRDPEPPFDDERAALAAVPAVGTTGAGMPTSGSAASGVQGALALAFALPSGVPAEPSLPAAAPSSTGRGARRLRLVPEAQPGEDALPGEHVRTGEQSGTTSRRSAARRRTETAEEFGPQHTRCCPIRTCGPAGWSRR